MTKFPQPLPADDPSRSLVVARPDTDESLLHLAVVGDTYTIVLSSQDTGGQYNLIDMLIPPHADGPPPHRHGYEEMYYILEGQVELTVRDQTIQIGPGEAANIPAYAPHHFRNPSGQPARFLCMTMTTGQEKFFRDIGVPVATRTTPAPPLTDAEQSEMIGRALESGGRNGTELLPPT